MEFKALYYTISLIKIYHFYLTNTNERPSSEAHSYARPETQKLGMALGLGLSDSTAAFSLTCSFVDFARKAR